MRERVSERASAVDPSSEASSLELARQPTGASEHGSGRARGPVLVSGFLAALKHSDSEPLEIWTLQMGHSLVGQWNIFVQISMCPESLCKPPYSVRSLLPFNATLRGIKTQS